MRSARLCILCLLISACHAQIIAPAKTRPPGANDSVMPDELSGSDFGAKINAAIAQTASRLEGYGLVSIPPGSYAFSTTINLANHPNIILDCQGANLTYTGNTIAIDALQPAGTNATGGIENCNVYSPPTARPNITAFRFGNLLNYRFIHNSAWNFSAAGDIGLLIENTNYFTEDSLISENQMRQVTIGYEFLKSCGSSSSCTNSAEYTFFHGNYWNSPYSGVPGQVGLLISGGIALQNSVVELHANINAPGSGSAIIKLATANDQILRDQIAIQGENTGNISSAYRVINNGAFYANGTLFGDVTSDIGNKVYWFGGSDSYIGSESTATSSSNVIYGSTYATNSNVLPDSEDRFGAAYWTKPVGNFEVGTSPANTGHTDFGYWNMGRSTISCASGGITSQSFTLSPGTYTISAGQSAKGTNTTGCSGPYSSVAILVDGKETVDLYGSRDPNAPVAVTLPVASKVTWEFHYAGQNFPPGAYLAWYAPQIEQGKTMTAYKASLWGRSTPNVGSPFTFTACDAGANSDAGRCSGTEALPAEWPTANYQLVCTPTITGGANGYITITSKQTTSFNYQLVVMHGAASQWVTVDCVLY